MAEGGSTPPERVSPCFVIHDNLAPPSDGLGFKYVDGLEVCRACERVTGPRSVDGAQRIGKLWRIYPVTNTARETLLVHGFEFGNRSVSLLSFNPFTVSPSGHEIVKLMIGGVALSVATSEIEKTLDDLKVTRRSAIKMENYREKTGGWTSYKTGRRFVYIDKPILNLGTYVKIGLWHASLYYEGQIRPQRTPRDPVRQDESSPASPVPASQGSGTTISEARDPASQDRVTQGSGAPVSDVDVSVTQATVAESSSDAPRTAAVVSATQESVARGAETQVSDTGGPAPLAPDIQGSVMTAETTEHDAVSTAQSSSELHTTYADSVKITDNGTQERGRVLIRRERPLVRGQSKLDTFLGRSRSVGRKLPNSPSPRPGRSRSSKRPCDVAGDSPSSGKAQCTEQDSVLSTSRDHDWWDGASEEKDSPP